MAGSGMKNLQYFPLSVQTFAQTENLPRNGGNIRFQPTSCGKYSEFNRWLKSVFPGRVDTQSVNKRIKTGPKKAILLNGVVVKRKQVFKTKPRKAILPSGVAVRRKQVFKTKPEKAVLPSEVAVQRKQVLKTKPEKAVLPSKVAAQRKQVIKTRPESATFPWSG
jgi:hypothetical protein